MGFSNLESGDVSQLVFVNESCMLF